MCWQHVYDLNIIVALHVGIEHVLEVVRKQLLKWNGACGGVLRKGRPDVVGRASGYLYPLKKKSALSNFRYKGTTHHRPVGSWLKGELKGLVGVRSQVDRKDVARVRL
jgi:hypothetical protein